MHGLSESHASVRIGVAVFCIIAALIFRAENISGGRRERDGIVSRHEIGKEIIAIRSRCGRPGYGVARAIRPGQGHGYARNASFPSILNPIGIFIEPDEIAETRGLIKAEIHARIIVGIRVAVAGFAAGCQGNRITLDHACGCRISIGIGIIVVIRVCAALRQGISGRRRDAHHVIAWRQIRKRV